jgi:hypothetical protein
MKKLKFLREQDCSTIYSKAEENAKKAGIKIGAKIKSVRIKTIFGRDDIFTTVKGLNYSSSLILVEKIEAIIHDSRVGYYTHSYFPMIIVTKKDGEKIQARNGGISFPIAIEYNE